MNTRILTKQARRGVGIIEALVALLVLALGMVSIAALQARLRLNSDVAKQRSEAVRIAQEDIENIRAFGTLAADGTIANNYAFNSAASGTGSTKSVLSSTSTITNTTFTVTRTVSNAPISAGLTDAPVKNLAISVAWTDRTGGAQSVTLRTVVAQSDPAISASLSLPPNGTPVRGLLGRDIQVPIPAKNLGNGTSAVKPLAGGTVAYVFANDSGVVTQRCTGISSSLVTNSLTLSDFSSAGVVCTNINAYLVSGFVRTSLGSNPDKTNPNDVAPGPLAMRMDFDSTAPPSGYAGLWTQQVAANWPTVNSATGVTIGSGATYTPAECNAEALQTVRYTTPVTFTQVNNGVTQTVTSTTVIGIIPQSVTTINSNNVAPWVGMSAANVQNPQATGEKFVGYACLVYPLDLDLNASTALAFTARLTVWPITGWALGTTGSTYKICRYSSDYNLSINTSSYAIFKRTNSSGVIDNTSGTHVQKIDNSEHPYAYQNAQRSLSNQNFLIIDGNRNCPTDGAVEVDGQGGENYTDEGTVTHQP